MLRVFLSDTDGGSMMPALFLVYLVRIQQLFLCYLDACSDEAQGFGMTLDSAVWSKEGEESGAENAGTAGIGTAGTSGTTPTENESQKNFSDTRGTESTATAVPNLERDVQNVLQDITSIACKPTCRAVETYFHGGTPRILAVLRELRMSIRQIIGKRTITI